jgi:hypothetical protein
LVEVMHRPTLVLRQVKTESKVHGPQSRVRSTSKYPRVLNRTGHSQEQALAREITVAAQDCVCTAALLRHYCSTSIGTGREQREIDEYSR